MVWVNNAQLDPRSRYPEGMRPEREHFIAVPLKGRMSIFGILVVARNRDPDSELFARAQKRIPGGVNSPVRAFRNVSGEPFFVARAVIPSRARRFASVGQALCSTEHSEIRDLLVVGFIGAGTALFFWRLLAEQVWMPAGGGDLAQFLYPTFSFAAEWWRRGIVPLWNPYLFAGAPFVGDIQSGIFYPLNLLTFLITGRCLAHCR